MMNAPDSMGMKRRARRNAHRLEALWLLACTLTAGCATQAPPSCQGACLTVHGTKDADHSLGFSVAYATTSTDADCVSVNRMAGVTTPLTRREFARPIRDGVTYELSLPLDQHVGGACGWRPVAVSLDVVSVASVRQPPKPGISLFLVEPGTTRSIERVALSCRRSAYQGTFGEQAAYLCLVGPGAESMALGDGSHRVEVNFDNRR